MDARRLDSKETQELTETVCFCVKGNMTDLNKAMPNTCHDNLLSAHTIAYIVASLSGVIEQPKFKHSDLRGNVHCFNMKVRQGLNVDWNNESKWMLRNSRTVTCD